MDRRIKYTKKVIKDTFITLLEQKEINKITVSEICKIADINRATFYRYYLDVYDLLDKIEDEFVETLKLANESMDNDYTVHSFAKPMLSVFLDNKKLVKILFSSKNYSFLEEILSIAYDRCKNKWEKDLTGVSSEDIEYASVYIFNGALGVINYWIANDFDKNINEISNIIENLSYYGIKNYIYDKRRD